MKASVDFAIEFDINSFNVISPISVTMSPAPICPGGNPAALRREINIRNFSYTPDKVQIID